LKFKNIRGCKFEDPHTTANYKLVRQRVNGWCARLTLLANQAAKCPRLMDHRCYKPTTHPTGRASLAG